MVVDKVLVGLRDSEVEWVFDKGRLFGRSGSPQHLSFIVSAAYRSSPKPNAELLAAAVVVLRRYFPAMAGATVTRSLVMREPEATFSAGPDTEAFGPGPSLRYPASSLMREAMRASGARTKRATVERGLRLLIEIKGQSAIRRLRGSVKWTGDLDQSRRDRIVSGR